MKEQYHHFPRVAPCLLAIVVDYMGFGLVYPLITIMFSEGGTFGAYEGSALKEFLQGLAYLLHPLTMFFGACILGDLSDKYGRKSILLLALFGLFLSFLLMSGGIWSKSITLFLIGRACSGLFSGSQPLAQAAVADISTPETKKWNMSLITLANNVGLIFGPLVAGFFTETWFVEMAGFAVPFLFSALMALVTIIWLAKSFEETFVSRPEKHIGWLRPIHIFVEGFKDFHIRPLVLILLLFQVSVALFYQMIAIYLSKTYGYSSSLLGYFYGYVGFFFLIGITIVYPFFLKRHAIGRLIWMGLLGMGLSIILVGLIPMQFFIWLFAALFAVTNVFAWTSFLAYYSNQVSPQRQGWAMGIFAGVVAFSFMLTGWGTNLLPWVSGRAQVTIGGLISILAGFYFFCYLTLKENA